MSINENELPNMEISEASAAELKSIIDFWNRIKDVKILLNETGVTPRVFNSWKNLGLIPINDPERRWSKFNFSEFLWLKIIQELREFGLSIEKILMIKNVLFPNNVIGEILEFLNGNENFAFEEIDALSQYNEETKEFFKIIVRLKPEDRQSFYDSLGLEMSLLDSMLINSVIKRKNNGLIIYSSGECIPWSDQFYEIDKDSGKDFVKPHIFISFSAYIIDFLFDEKLEAFISPIHILSKEEQEIISLLRTNELKEVKIKFSEKSNKPYILEIVSGKQVSTEEAQQLMRNMVFKNYESISFKTNNNKSVYIEKVQKKIL